MSDCEMNIIATVRSIQMLLSIVDSFSEIGIDIEDNSDKNTVGHKLWGTMTNLDKMLCRQMGYTENQIENLTMDMDIFTCPDVSDQYILDELTNLKTSA